MAFFQSQKIALFIFRNFLTEKNFYLAIFIFRHERSIFTLKNQNLKIFSIEDHLSDKEESHKSKNSKNKHSVAHMLQTFEKWGFYRSIKPYFRILKVF